LKFLLLNFEHWQFVKTVGGGLAEMSQIAGMSGHAVKVLLYFK
jgi:hypothetical protein